MGERSLHDRLLGLLVSQGGPISDRMLAWLVYGTDPRPRPDFTVDIVSCRHLDMRYDPTA